VAGGGSAVPPESHQITRAVEDDAGRRNARIGCRAVHSIRGRVRLRIDDPALLKQRGQAFEAFLREQAGVHDVRADPESRSVVLNFEPERLDVSRLVERIEDLSPDGFPTPTTGAVEPEGGSSWIPLALSGAAVALAALGETAMLPWLLAGAAVPIVARAFESVASRGKLNVDTLDAAATALLVTRGQFQTAAVMVCLVSLGDFIRDLTLYRSRRAIEDLFDGKGHFAWLVRDGKKIQVAVEDVQHGDEVVVYPGELIPVDGVVRGGRAMVDQKTLTGESMPVEKEAGSPVYAATALREGKLYIEASKVGSETLVAKVVQLVRDAPIRETRAQSYAEHFADRIVPWSFLGAGGMFLATGTVDQAAALLIVDYGTGIRVAAPTTVLSSLARAARQGILIKGGRCLEQLAEIDVVVFDKTGTLTVGDIEVVEILPTGHTKVAAERVLALAAAAEERLTHPISEAIVRAAKTRGVAIPERDASHYVIGLGVEASVEGETVLVGCERFMKSKGVTMRRTARGARPEAEGGASPIFVAADGELIGVLVCSDPVRPEAADVVRGLRARGVHDVIMLTGDQPSVASRVAEAVGISRYIADALPEEKSAFVRNLQREGRRVALVGDGINDSPALAQADVGIAVGGGAEIAHHTAHVGLLHGDLSSIPKVIDLARDSMRLIQQNWAINLYGNTAAIALSLAGFIGPIGATLLSNGSAIASTLNGLRPWLTPPSGSDERRQEPLQRELDGRPRDGMGELLPKRRPRRVAPLRSTVFGKTS
jgi:Cu2+-exporting ATPase